MEFKNLKNLKKIEGEKAECYKCGKQGEPVYEDPNIEDLYFCAECWEERFKTEKLSEMGMEEELPFDD